MDCTTSFLPYKTTGFFSKIVADYLHQHPSLVPFYQHAPNWEGMAASITARKKNIVNRTVLVDVLNQQYAALTTINKVHEHIQLLGNTNTFTVTTAHQPNIFTGPLYFIYKILHTVKLAEELSMRFPREKFVPVYYMGSEDADLNELGFINVGEQKLVWETKQTGAVGRMKVDKAFIKLIHAIAGQIGVQPFGDELVAIFNNCYTEGKTIQQATLELVNELFGVYGVVVLIPDNTHFKRLFIPVIEKELTEQFSQKAVEKTIEALKANYKVQAAGRPINLFYLLNDQRERIELIGDEYQVAALSLSFSQQEILQELNDYPERFSPNVILRGAFQETILPNIAFIGGGGELAYWLELKNVFQEAGVPYPVLLMRNSFLWMQKQQHDKLVKLEINTAAIFESATANINRYVKNHTANQLDLAQELNQAETLYQQLFARANSIDPSLNDHIISLQNKALKKIKEVEKKMLRAEKRKFNTAIAQINQLKTSLFPADSLQERHANMALFYAKYGKEWITAIYQSSTAIDQQFAIVVAPD